MKAILTSALVGLGLAFTPVEAHAAEVAGGGKGSGKAVSYVDALACSTLFSVLGGSAEDSFDEADLIDIAARWLVIAMDRKGIGSDAAEKELLASLERLMAELKVQGSDSAREEFLLQGVDACEGHYELIAEEFDSITLS